MSDPVASKSTFLCTYMTSHPDTLVAYVKHFGHVHGNVFSAQMKSIDCQGMNLSYALGKNGGVGSVHVKFDPPLAGYNDVKPRLLSMKAEAQDALGMRPSPRITSFRLPCRAVYTLYLFLGIAYVTWAPPRGTSLPFIPTNVTDMVFAPAHTVLGVIGFRPSTTRILHFFGVLHSLEGMYTWYLCRRYVKGPLVNAAYMVSTFFCGLSIPLDLKKRVQEKRIESVMRVD